MSKYRPNPIKIQSMSQKGEKTLKNVKFKHSDFLPAVNRTEPIERFFDSTVDELLSSGNLEDINHYWGNSFNRNNKKKYNIEKEYFKNIYQFSPGIVSKEDRIKTLSYSNFLKKLESFGVDLTNHDKLFSEEGYILNVPIDIDMFMNYNNYYWLEGDIPVIEIDDTIEIDDILNGRLYYTTPDSNIKFVSGIKVKFLNGTQNGNDISDNEYYVENVGNLGGIKLVKTKDGDMDVFPYITPYIIDTISGWDTDGWDDGDWDEDTVFDSYDENFNSRIDLDNNRSYIVMERWDNDKNPWARSNRWFSIHAIREMIKANDININYFVNNKTRAKRPIIQYNASIELHNFGNEFIQLVTYTLTNEQYNSGSIQGFNLQDNDTFIITDITDNTIYTVDSSGTITENTISDNNKYVIISDGENYGKVYISTDNGWTPTQSKEERGTHPLFNLYDSNFNPLNDRSDNDFNGDYIFKFKEDKKNSIDLELGFSPSYRNDETRELELEWILNNVRYFEDIEYDERDEVRGYYYFYNKEYDNYHNGWETIHGGQRVPVIQTKKAESDNDLIFDLKTQNYKHTTDLILNFRFDRFQWFSKNLLEIENSTNGILYLRRNTDYNVKNLILDSTSSDKKIEFLDPDENSFSITDGNVNSDFILNIPEDYSYDTIRYRSTDDNSIVGEITVISENSNRITVKKNNNLLIFENDYSVENEILTVNSSSLENDDIVKVSYITDDDIEDAIYDIAPVHYYNTNNKSLTTISFSELSVHFERQMIAIPGFFGNSNDENNYYNISKRHNYDGTIRQQIRKTSRFQYLLDRDDVNPFICITKASDDYTSFVNYFKNKTKQLWTTGSYDRISDLVDEALYEINIGKNKDFKYAFSDMVYYKNSEELVYLITDTEKVYDLPNIVNDYGHTENHVYVWLKQYDSDKDKYIEKQLVSNVDYKLSENSLTLEESVSLDSGNTAATLTIKWYNTQELSHVPFSTVKLGFFPPTTVEVVNGILIGHDGVKYQTSGTEYYDLESDNFDVVTSCLIELETRIFNGLVSEHYNIAGLNNYYPNSSNVSYQTLDDINSKLDDWYNRWLSENNITVEEIGYDANDKFSWNYSSVGPGIGGWRGLYNYYFGTYKPHTHPWEILDFFVKPSWWDDHYSWKLDRIGISDIDTDSNVNPSYRVVITTVNDHGLSTGDMVSFENVVGNGPNGRHELNEEGQVTITVLSSTKFIIDNSDIDNYYDYVSGGNVVVQDFTKINALKKALYFGIRTNPDNTTQSSSLLRSRNSYDWFNNDLVDTNGNLNDPVTSGIVNEPSLVERSKALAFGDWGEIETLWRGTSEYKFALVEILLQIKPYFVFENYWSLRNTRYQFNTSSRQIYNNNTEIRQDDNEIHNQLITSGVLVSAKFGNAGNSYNSPSIELSKSQFRYQNPRIEYGFDSGSFTWIKVENIGRNLGSDVVEYSINGGSGAEIDFDVSHEYYLTKLGWNSIISEFYSDQKNKTVELYDILRKVDLQYLVELNGYTDKKIIDIKLDSINNSGVITLFDEDYDITIDSNLYMKSIFYSGIKLEKEDGKFTVSGYDYDRQTFEYYPPNKNSMSNNVDITDNISLVKYNSYSNNKEKLPYGYQFTRRQDLFDFIMGLGEYYERNQFKIKNIWENQLIEVIRWSLDDSTDPFYMNGVEGSIFYEQGLTGIVQPFTNDNRFFSILNKNRKPIKRSNINIFRNETDTEIFSNDGIFGLKLCIIEYDHILVINNDLQSGNSIYKPELGISLNDVLISGRRTRNWNGRLSANGYLIRNDGLANNIETSIREVERDWINDASNILEGSIQESSWINVGFNKPSYMIDTNVNDKSSYEFEKGMRKNKGTLDSIKTIGRNKNVFGKEFDEEVYEEWMVRLGDYGNTNEREPLQFEIYLNEITSDKQEFSFSKYYDVRKPTKFLINYHENGLGYISGNFAKPFEVYDTTDTSLISSVENQQEFLNDIGLPLLNEIDFVIRDQNEIGSIFNPTEEYALIPNWKNNEIYRKGDKVRYEGSVYSLNIDTTGSGFIDGNIVITGTQTLPIVENGKTLIINDQEIVFDNTEEITEYQPASFYGSIINPRISSGNGIVIDSEQVDFIKTRSAYGDIVITGTTDITSALSSDEEITLYYANSSTVTLSEFTISLETGDDLDEIISKIDTELSTQRVDNFISVEKDGNKIKLTRSNSAQLEGIRFGISDNTTFGFSDVDDVSSPKIYEDITILGSVENPDVSEINISDIELDQDRSVRITTENKHNLKSEDVIKITDVVGTTELNYDMTDDNTYTVFVVNDFTITLDNTISSNFTSYSRNGKISIRNPDDSSDNVRLSIYYADDVVGILNEIELLIPLDQSLDDTVSAINSITEISENDISATNSDNKLQISRDNNDNSSSIRLGVSDSHIFGFSGRTDVLVSELVIDTDLSLDDIIQAINSQTSDNIVADILLEDSNGDFTFDKEEGTPTFRLRITKYFDSDPASTQFTLSSSDSLTSLGFSGGTKTSVSVQVEKPINSEISDIVSYINSQNIEHLTTRQLNGALEFIYSGEQLIIGEGTVNEIIGIAPSTYYSQLEEGLNIFQENDWIKVRDSVDISILIINSVSSGANRTSVFHSVDLDIGIIEICPGSENGNDALVECRTSHVLNEGDYVFILGSTSTPSVDGIHKVTSIINDKDFLIDRYINEKGIENGKIIPLKSISFNNKTEALDILNNPEYFDLTQTPKNRKGLFIGTKVYVDDYEDGVGAVLKLLLNKNNTLEFIVDRYEQPKINNRKLKNVTLFNIEDSKTVIEYDIFDPSKGIIPKVVDREVDIKSDTDIAFYNNTTNTNKNLVLKNSWGDNQIGKVWWDLSNAIYVNYDQGDSNYKHRYWGELVPGSSIDVYEWTKSTVTPDQYENIIGNIIDGTEVSGVPYSTINEFGELEYYWCEDNIVNSFSGVLETYYYFWVKNKTTVPNMDRRYTVLQIANIIRNPESEQIQWAAAIGENSILATGLTQITGYSNLAMKIDFHSDENDYHQEFILLTENDPKTVIPEWLHMSLKNSLVSYTTIVKYAEYVDYVSGNSYDKDSIVKSGDEFYQSTIDDNDTTPSIDSLERWRLLDVIEENPDGYFGNRKIIGYGINKLVPDETLHPSVRYGIQTRPSQSWFVNIDNARRAFFQKLNSQLLTINLIDSSLNWRGVFDEEYWSFVDWHLDRNTIFFKELADISVDTFQDLLNLEDQPEGRLVYVNDNMDSDDISRKAAYRRKNGIWKLIFKENATIQINADVWNKNLRNPTRAYIPAGWDLTRWDSTPWDKGLDVLISELMDSLYSDLWTGFYARFYNDLWFFMVKYVLKEQNEVDWIFKTSYLKLNWNIDLNSRLSNYFKYRVEDLYDYINTVKPFRSKISDSKIKPQSIENVGVDNKNTIEIRVQTGTGNDARTFSLMTLPDGDSLLYQVIDSQKYDLDQDFSKDDTTIVLEDTLDNLNTGSMFLKINSEIIEIDSNNITRNGNISTITDIQREQKNTIRTTAASGTTVEKVNILDTTLSNNSSIELTGTSDIGTV